MPEPTDAPVKTIDEIFSNFVFSPVQASPQTIVLFTRREPGYIGLTNPRDLDELKKSAESLIKQAELRGELSGYTRIVELRSPYVYDEYSTLYQKSTEIRSEYFDKENEFIEKQRLELQQQLAELEATHAKPD